MFELITEEGSIMQKKKTVGQEYVDNFAKNTYKDLVPTNDLMSEMLTDYEKEVWECYYRMKSTYKKNFALVVLLVNKERTGIQGKSAKFFTRHTVPTPDFDQIVYWCHKDTDTLEYLWCIPDAEQCMLMYQYKEQVPASEYCLLRHVLDFADGTLLKTAKKYNNEDNNETGRIIITSKETK